MAPKVPLNCGEEAPDGRLGRLTKYLSFEKAMDIVASSAVSSEFDTSDGTFGVSWLLIYLMLM